MTRHNYPTDWMDNPDGRDYHYRFKGNNEDAWRKVRYARIFDRMIELYPKDMKHLRTDIDHVTVKTYDHKGHIKGLREYAVSPDWRTVPHTLGRMEVNNANGGGSRVKKRNHHSGEAWGKIDVQFHVDFTPSEIIAAYEDGENEDAVRDAINQARHYAVDDRIEELKEQRYQYQQDCDHDHVVKGGTGVVGYCEDCQKAWHDSMEWDHAVENGKISVVGEV